MAEKTPVALVRCASYDQAEVDEAVRQCFVLLPELGAALKPGTEVLLKINLTQLCAPESTVITHPAMVSAVGRELLGRGMRVVIGESSGGSGWKVFRKMKQLLFEKLANSMKGRRFDECIGFHDYLTGIRSYSDLMKRNIAGLENPAVKREELGADTDIDFYVSTGMKAVAEEIGAALSYFDLEELVDVPSPAGRFLEMVPVCRPVTAAGRVISTAKFKTHEDMVITGALKNFFGIIPTPLRSGFHTTGKLAGLMAEMLVDVFSVVKPAPLAITDAVWGMEGRGPLDGTPRFMGLVMASPDCVAHDAVMAALMGLDPMAVPMVRIAHESGLGQGLLENIEVRGVPVNEARQPDWKITGNVGRRLPWH